jgi:hypothetical protein
VFFVLILFSSLLFASFAGTSFAAKGEVVYKKIGCDYFIVETGMGYCASRMVWRKRS